MNRAYPPDGDFAYKSVAVYYEEADSLEYVRRDEPSIYRRIDDLLTLVLSMNTREPVGFQLKGFRHFYLEHIKDRLQNPDMKGFPELITIMEEAVRSLGDEVFAERERRCAYTKALDMAKEDEVHFAEIPVVA